MTNWQYFIVLFKLRKALKYPFLYEGMGIRPKQEKAMKYETIVVEKKIGSE
jgi:hypothetical protein